MSKEVKELFATVIVLSVQILYLAFILHRDFPQPGYGILVTVLVGLTAYFSYQAIGKAAVVVSSSKSIGKDSL